jgi:predicted dehydrogenase
MLKATIIGAGGRATRAHYPVLANAVDDVSIEAVCDLDDGRLNAAADTFGIPHRYTDYRQMLDQVDCDVVYAIMQPFQICPVAINVLDAGKHLMIEKPPGANSTETALIAEAASRNNRVVCVSLQRRWTQLICEAKRRVETNGPIRFVLAGMHKHQDMQTPTSLKINVMYDRDIHMIDFIRWVCGGNWNDVRSHTDNAYTNWVNSCQAIVSFSSGAVGVHTAIGHAGSRYYRIELHGNGISAYLNPPGYGEVFVDGADEPEILNAETLTGDPNGALDDGIAALHKDFFQCLRDGRTPLTSIHDVVHSMRLLEEMGQLDAAGQPLVNSG